MTETTVTAVPELPAEKQSKIRALFHKNAVASTDTNETPAKSGVKKVYVAGAAVLVAGVAILAASKLGSKDDTVETETSSDTDAA